MPRPPPSIARTSDKSTTTTREFLWERIASRRRNAASLWTSLPSHCTTAMSPTLSIWMLNMIPPCDLWCTHYAVTAKARIYAGFVGSEQPQREDLGGSNEKTRYGKGGTLLMRGDSTGVDT